MSQETRKDPRAKVLSMTVRYKSATLDEFIEHHSYDVSRGGMYIKTPKPFPPGTLLKFEVRIAENQRVMQGVGRVVWKRNPTEADDGHPAGMGVKFIKLDDDSKALIDQLVVRRRDEDSEFERGDETTPAAGVAALRAQASERNKVDSRASIPVVDTARDGQSADAPFFPPTDSEAGAPPREDRTMLKQAAELLQDALREAGGSVEELGATPEKSAPPKTEVEAAQDQSRPEGGPDRSDGGPRSDPAMLRRQRRESDSKALAEESGSGSSGRAVSLTAGAAGARARSPSTPARVVAMPEDEGRGAGKLVLLIVAVAAAVALVFYLTRKTESGAPTAAEPPTAVEAPVPEPRPAASVLPVDASVAADAADASAAVAEADAGVTLPAQEQDAPAPEAQAVPVPEAPVARPVVSPQPRVRRTPAPALPADDSPVPEVPVPEAPVPEVPGGGQELPVAPVAPKVVPSAPAVPPASPPSPPLSDNPYE